MAFLVEHKALGNNHSGAVNTIHADATATTTRSRPSTMKLFRRQSSNTNSIERASPPQSRKPSVTEPERRSSLTAIPARLRRRRTKSSANILEQGCQSAIQLGQLLCSLPSEILVQIICNLCLNDIYSLRLTSRWFVSLLDHNASAISRYVLSHVLPEHTFQHVYSLYPPPSPCPDLRYLLQILHRQHRIDKVVYSTLSYVQFTTYMMNSRSLNPSASWNPTKRQTLAEILQRPTWTTYHFLETYRDIITSKHDENQHGKESGRFWDCTVCEKKAKDLIKSYKDKEIIPAFHFMELLTQHYRAATRAPINPGPKLSRWSRTTLTEEDRNIFVFLGGIEELHKINHMQGSYNKRIEIIDGFATKVKTAIDINHANARTSEPSSSAEREGEECRTKDLTRSLAPPYAKLTKDHLDRLPNLNEFLLPIWQDRIERDNLYGGKEQAAIELEKGPFEWIETVLYHGTADPVVSPLQQSQNEGEGEGEGENENEADDESDSDVQNDGNPHILPLIDPTPTPTPMPNFGPASLLRAPSYGNSIRLYGSAPI